MKQPGTYSLVVDDIKRADLTVERLAQYLEQFARLLGNPEGVHFKELRKGSCQIVANVDIEYRKDIYDRIRSIGKDAANNKEVVKIYNKINDLLEQDNSTGSLKVPGRKTKVIDFLGVERKKEESTKISEEGSIQGTLYELGGLDDTINIGLRTAGYGDVRATILKSLAEDLKVLLWKEVRLFGSGQWVRTAEGWKLSSFTVNRFEELDSVSLIELTSEVRELSVELWTTNDPIQELEKARSG